MRLESRKPRRFGRAKSPVLATPARGGAPILLAPQADSSLLTSLPCRNDKVALGTIQIEGPNNKKRGHKGRVRYSYSLLPVYQFGQGEVDMAGSEISRVNARI